MNPKLARRLIEKGAIREHTVFEAHYKTKGLSCVEDSDIVGQFVILAAKTNQDGHIILEARPENGKNKFRFTSSEILMIDGMDIMRFAGTYDLNMDGSDMAVMKRRGRRPRSMMVEV